MEVSASHRPISSEKLHELTLLYQFSNTMLSTIRLNKLIHLILTGLTATSSQFFERAMLFLRNEKSGVLQGMLGVSRENSSGLQIIGSGDHLTSRWDISDETMRHQRDSAFSIKIRSTRVESDENCPLIRRTVIEQHLYTQDDPDVCRSCDACDFIARINISIFAAVPLIARGRVLGLIIVDNPDSMKAMNRDELHFLQLIANQAGMAIENSMLYNRIEEAHSNLRDARERLTHGERLAAIGEMAANIAHELKNPLVTIGGFAGRLLKGYSDESKEHHYADTIVREVGRLERMLAEILTFSKKPTICYSQCDLVDIIDDCIDNCTGMLEDHQINLTTSMVPKPLTMLGDSHQLKQVFLNLMLNACEVMENGGSLYIEATTSADRKIVLISIRDTGGGIPHDLLPRVFNPFFTTKCHGTGLGLAIVNRIVVNHGGSIEVANEGGGAVFTVSLPLAESH